MSRLIMMLTTFVFVIAVSACASATPAPTTQPPVVAAPTTAAPVAGMPNPASVFCQQNGGKTDIRKDAKGGEVGYCVFPDKSECEEFAYMRGECKPGGASSTSAGSAATADPFAYCATVGNLDAPDARWTGAKVPDAVLTGLVKAAGISSDMPKDVLANSSFWRCMNNKVYACTVGANLPCQEKADLNKTPSAALNDYCKANPSADIPAVVTGRATVYSWKCVSGKPTVDKELFKADARGFISDFWYEIKATSAAPGATTATGATTQVAKADNGKTIQVAVGGTVVVTLEGNPGSTGYLWGLESGNDAVLKPAGDYKFTSTSNLPGASGKFEFKFTAASAGSATLKFSNKRAWELNDPQAETFNVTVNVK